MPDETPSSLNIGDVFKYASIVEQVIAAVKSVRGSGVGTVHEMPTVKTWIGDAYFEWDMGPIKRLK